ncbi:hypothetical protein ACWD4J_10865 [Streptomyces sp. NPDC002577]
MDRSQALEVRRSLAEQLPDDQVQGTLDALDALDQQRLQLWGERERRWHERGHDRSGRLLRYAGEHRGLREGR